MADQKIVLRINNLSHDFGKLSVLNSLSFDIHEFETVCILGPSGCGKTTLLRLITGLLPIQTGDIELSGFEINQENEYKNHLGLVFQEPRLLPWKTALDNVLLPFELNQKQLTLEQKEQAHRALQLVGLSDFEDCYPKELSGGMRQRVALARALITNPDLLLLDEPLTGLDVHTKEELQDEFLSLKNQTNKTMLWVTHDPQEAIYVADRIIVLSARPTEIKEIITVNHENARERLGSYAIELEQHIRTLFD